MCACVQGCSQMRPWQQIGEMLSRKAPCRKMPKTEMHDNGSVVPHYKLLWDISAPVFVFLCERMPRQWVIPLAILWMAASSHTFKQSGLERDIMRASASIKRELRSCFMQFFYYFKLCTSSISILSYKLHLQGSKNISISTSSRRQRSINPSLHPRII